MTCAASHACDRDIGAFVICTAAEGPPGHGMESAELRRVGPPRRRLAATNALS